LASLDSLSKMEKGTDRGKISLCVNTQTPFVRFKLNESEILEKYGQLSHPVRLTSLSETEDFDFTPGGVSGMVYSLLLRLAGQGFVSNVDWISLGPSAPPQVDVNDKVKLRHVYLEGSQVLNYASFKEKIYNEAHGLSRMHVEPEEYEAYVTYNWLSAKLMMSLRRGTDLYYIHDFQQLFVGTLLGVSAPAIFHWHIPFIPERFGRELRGLVLKNIEAFDAMIVSTRRDLEGLVRAGYRGRAYQVYPYIDPNKWYTPSVGERARVREELGLTEADPLILCVGRMDPIKGQDVAIKAVARVKDEFPRIRLVLVGNGSFTSSQSGGLAHPKAKQWQSHLRKMVVERGLRDSVVFTGHLGDDWLRCLYSLADAVVVPSQSEGFNLTTVEAWMYNKPVLVSTGAGSSELVINGANGYTFEPGDDKTLSQRLGETLHLEDRGGGLGENGALTAKQCYVEKAQERLQEIFTGCLDTFERNRTQDPGAKLTVEEEALEVPSRRSPRP
jgi:glycosyltransferase involved in cell wall biosynthesis